MDVSFELFKLNINLFDAQKLIAQTLIKLHNLQISAPISDDEFMDMVKPMYEAGMGELMKTINMGQLYKDLTKIN